MGIVAAGLALALMLLMAAVPGFEAALFRLIGAEDAPVPVQGLPDGPVRVHFIDVGQGDAVLLEADGAFALLDAGPPEAAEAVVRYLAAVGADQLEYMVMTHPHADHYGGMQAVLNAVPVKTVILPDFAKAPYPTATSFVDLLEEMLRLEIPAKTVKTGDEYALGSGVIRVLADGVATKDNYNLLSPALLFEAGGLRFLDTGDGEAANERALLEAGADVRADLLKAGHHGSSTSNTPAFLAAVAPQLVVASCGKDNSYGHPHRETREALEKEGILLLRTDEDGSVAVAPGADGQLVFSH